MAAQPDLLEFLTTTRIGEKGQLTVPKQFREDLGLGNGAPFAVLRMGDGLILLPEQRRFDQLCRQISSALASAGIAPEELQESLPEARRRVYDRRYGRSAPEPAPAKRRAQKRKSQ
jgi:AbrB family looped-hinge helix DNA binding protein